jgi:hypothetical protein
MAVVCHFISFIYTHFNIFFILEYWSSGGYWHIIVPLKTPRRGWVGNGWPGTSRREVHCEKVTKPISSQACESQVKFNLREELPIGFSLPQVGDF